MFYWLYKNKSYQRKLWANSRW